MPTVVRRADRNDLEPLIELVREYCLADGHAFDPTIARTGLTGLLDDDHLGVVLVAVDVDDGRDTQTPASTPIGYAAATWGWSIEIGGPEAVLDEVYVRRRGEGIGGRLIDEIERECRDRGMRRIFLETERSNEGARRLYRRHGYTADDSIWMAKLLT